MSPEVVLTLKELVVDHVHTTLYDEKVQWQPPLDGALRGLTAAAAAWKPAPARHSIWQIVRHLILWKRAVLQAWDGILAYALLRPLEDLRLREDDAEGISLLSRERLKRAARVASEQPHHLHRGFQPGHAEARGHRRVRRDQTKLELLGLGVLPLPGKVQQVAALPRRDIGQRQNTAHGPETHRRIEKSRGTGQYLESRSAVSDDLPQLGQGPAAVLHPRDVGVRGQRDDQVG
jgi:hypothetical protein